MGGISPDAFSMLVGGKGSRRKEANRTYLTGLPNHGSPLLFPTYPQTHTQPHARVDINVVWPTSLAGGERPGSTEFACGGT